MTSEFSLRRAGNHEAEMLSALMTETFLAAYGHVAPADSLERHIERSYAPARVRDLLDRGKIEVWVLDATTRASSGGTEAGYVQLGLDVPTPAQLTPRRSIEVQRCYMRPEFIGAGGAPQLMRKAQQRAVELDAQALHLSVYQHAPRAVRFYEKHGFRRAAAIKFHIDAVEFDDWLMVWEPDASTRGLS
jgi:ribosomal protein S18 acetylase RimI-like enzyme